MTCAGSHKNLDNKKKDHKSSILSTSITTLNHSNSHVYRKKNSKIKSFNLGWESEEIRQIIEFYRNISPACFPCPLDSFPPLSQLPSYLLSDLKSLLRHTTI